MMQRAFVLQLKADCVAAGHFRGRVEHVRSGHATHFENLAEFIQFLSRSIDDEKRKEQLERELSDVRDP
jgi:hypothetical protein